MARIVVGVSPTWFWVQVLIALGILASIVIGIVKLSTV